MEKLDWRKIREGSGKSRFRILLEQPKPRQNEQRVNNSHDNIVTYD